MCKKNEGTNYGKIIAITLACVAGACAVVWFALKLYRKYCLLECEGQFDDEEFEELCDEALCAEDAGCDCEIVEEECTCGCDCSCEEAGAEA